MSNKVNWDIAPEDATHHGFVNNENNIAWYKFEANDDVRTQWSFWYSEDGILNEKGWTKLPIGQAPLQLPVTPRPKVVVPPAPETIAWRPGSDLPPVGLVVELSENLKDKDSRMFKWDAKKGEEVKIIHHIIGAGNGDQDVAVFLYKMEDGTTRVRQAVARVFKKAKTPEEKARIAAAKKLEQDVVEIATKVGIPNPTFTEKNTIEKLLTAGLLK